jgi:DNA-binding beta-propeller fold protein YncE
MNDSSNWKFIVRNLYSLKRQYGAKVTVCKVLDVETDYITGEKTISRELHEVQRAIMLPVEEKRKVEQGIAHLSSNKMFVSQAGFDDEQALFIFDAKDLPAGFQFNLDDFVIVEDEYFRVTEVDEYEYDSGWVIKTHRTKGADFVLQPPPPPPFTGTATVFGTGLVGNSKWYGGALADNGFIYAAPLSSQSVLKIDPVNDTFSLVGSAITKLYKGAVQAPDGNIYCMPATGTAILKIDPTNDTVSTVGPENGDYKQGDTILADNGSIYGIPFRAQRPLRFDPVTEVFSQFGTFYDNTDKWNSGALAYNGCIYGMPRNATTILKIDTSDDSTSVFGSFPGSYKWAGGVAVGQYIYGMPSHSTTILKIDCSNDTATTFGGTLVGTNKWAGGILAPDGCIYGIPLAHTQVLKIDPSDDSVSLIDAIPALPSGYKWAHGVLAERRIYGFPYDGTNILRIA